MGMKIVKKKGVTPKKKMTPVRSVESTGSSKRPAPKGLKAKLSAAERRVRALRKQLGTKGAKAFKKKG